MAEVKDQVHISDLPNGMTDERLQVVFGAYGTIKWCRSIPSRTEGIKNVALVQFESPVDAQWFIENLDGNIPEGLTEPIQVQWSSASGASKMGQGQGKGKGKCKGGAENAGKGKKTVSPYASPYAAVNTWSSKGKDASWGPKGQDDSKGKGKDNGKRMKGILKGAINSGITPWGDEPRPDENCCYVKGLPSDCTDRDLYELFAPFGAILPKGVLAKQEGGYCTGIGWIDFVDQTCAQAAIEALSGMDNNAGGTLLVAIKNSTRGKGKGKDV